MKLQHDVRAHGPIFLQHRTWFIPVLTILLMVFLAGCATPIGTRQVGIKRTYEQINTNAIKKDVYSDATRSVLHRFDLEKQFDKDPAVTIETLHEIACEDDRRDLLYALSELSYLSAGKVYTSNTSGSDTALKAKNYYLASAVYAYFYLLGERGGAFPDPYDRRFRTASDFYNTALALSLLDREQALPVRNTRIPLPVGTLLVALDQDRSFYDMDTLETLVPSDTLLVHGLSVRDRRPGLGAPFVAVEKKLPGMQFAKATPGTLFMRVDGDIRNLRQGGGQASVELHSSYEKRVTKVRGKNIPLENDLSSQLAYSLNQNFLWDMGRLQFLKGPVIQSGVFPTQPYSPDRIPVVFVHGTFSSPVWWAEMFNTLRSDPVLWKNYQFWYYVYDSSKQLVLSAVDLREKLSERVQDLDPQGRNAALQKMVVVGHSQGGLLTKLTAVETGDLLVKAATGKKPDELEMTPEKRGMVEKYMIYSPLPFVKRVVFISTPHRGSYLANNWVRNLVQRFVTLPQEVLKTSLQFLAFAGETNIPGFEKKKMITSLDGMSPESPGLLALADIPLATGITGHSIISIKGDEIPPDGEDGVVKYTSAHVDYAQSEFIVRTGHSSQSHPLVIEEVRRILLAHLESTSALKD